MHRLLSCIFFSSSLAPETYTFTGSGGANKLQFTDPMGFNVGDASGSLTLLPMPIADLAVILP